MFGELHFWRDFLSDASPHIICPFGNQFLVIDTEFIHTTVTWPGVPEDTRPFSNTRFQEGLFTYAAYQHVLSSEFGEGDEWEREEWGSEEDWEKEEAMQHHLPTQILRQHTSEAAPDSKEIDHKSRVAWNFFSSMYFKTGGIPWSPKGLMAGTCYVGISFYRPLGSSSTARASVAQAFNEYGDGMVLRGQDFQWDTRTLSDHHPGGNLALNKDELEHNRFR